MFDEKLKTLKKAIIVIYFLQYFKGDFILYIVHKKTS